MKKCTLLFTVVAIFLTGCAQVGHQDESTVTRRFSGTDLPNDPVLQQVRELERHKVLTHVQIAESHPVQITATGSENVLTCLTTPGGRWVQEQQECEQMSEQSCTALGGEFNECASACRNQPDAMMCIQVCIPVCRFQKQGH